MKRQFVNLVTDNYMKGCYSLIRIKSTSLFYRIKQNGGTKLKRVVEEAVLPEPVLSFSSSRPKKYGGSLRFMPLGCSAEKIVSMDQDGRVLFYDTCQHLVDTMPMLNGGMRNPIPFAVGDDAVYLIEASPDCTSRPYQHGFHALIHGEPPRGVSGWPGWHWHPFPLPPYVLAPWYKPSISSKISSFAVVDENIWISARGIGTYSFDTSSFQWSEIGSWELPFCGSADYVDLNRKLLFGFLSGDKPLFCAVDLALAVPAGLNTLPPCCFWGDDLAALEDGSWLLSSHLVRVDPGRFVIGRLHQAYVGDDDEPILTKRFAVLTGVELLKHCSKADEVPQVVKHKSIRYDIEDNMVHCIF